MVAVSLKKKYWGFIPIGKARLVTRWIREGERWLLAIRIRTRSNRVIATVYPVDDVIETIVDPVPFRPLVFTKDLKEGRHRYHEITTFDYEKGMAQWMSVTKQETREYAITPELRDLISFMYFLRSKKFPDALDAEYRVVADEKIYTLTTTTHGREKKRIGHFGKVPCVEVEPHAEFQGLFVHEGRLRLWVSLRDRPLITYIKARTTLGSVRAVLSEVHGPGNDFWARKTREYVDDNDKNEEDPEVERALRELDARPGD